MLMTKNDSLAILYILAHIIIIFLIFAIAYYIPNPLVWVLCLFLLGGQQLACAILMHDASHYSILSNKSWNDLVGKYLGAYPIFNSLNAYRPYHQVHHLHTGTADDPDLMLTRGYPTDRRSMIRKISRDLMGITGFKSYAALFLLNIGYISYNQSGQLVKVAKDDRQMIQTIKENLMGAIFTNILLLGILTVLWSPWLYLLWLIASFTTFQFSLRIRSIAEHSVVPDQENPILNTRTTQANWIEKLLFAPYAVNYHLEHHMLMNVPFYNLPKMHAIIKKNGYFEKGLLATGYWEIIKMASTSKHRKLKYD